jgi:uncharacterized membrane protein
MGVDTILLLLSGSVAAVALVSAVAIRGWRIGSHKSAMASTVLAVPQTAIYFEPTPVAQNPAVETSASTQPPVAEEITNQTSSPHEEQISTSEVHEASSSSFQQPTEILGENLQQQVEVPAVNETTTTTPTAIMTDSTSSQTVESATAPQNDSVPKAVRRTSRSRANGTRRQRKKTN